MPHDSIYDKTRAVLDAAGACLGVPVHDARLLRLHSNANFALPSAGMVVRIATNPGALDRVATSIAVTRWLADRGFPCVVPADVDDQPLMIAGHVVSVWRYVPTTNAPAPTGADIGRLLRDLHAQGDPPHPLRRFGDPFASVASAMEEAPDSMPETSRSWLADRIAWLRGQWSGMDFPLPAGLIHGDAHISNLMRATSGEISSPSARSPASAPISALPVSSPSPASSSDTVCAHSSPAIKRPGGSLHPQNEARGQSWGWRNALSGNISIKNRNPFAPNACGPSARDPGGYC